jgi:Undecaprenyl-phosphate galactose phosphotransferase WbaP
MDLNEYESWYRQRYRRTSSALTTIFCIAVDLIAVMLCFGAGFFLVNLYDRSLITFRSFITYWPYLPAFILVFWALNLYPGASLAPAEELRRFTISSFLVHGGIILSHFTEDQVYDPVSIAFTISYVISVPGLLIGRGVVRSFLSVTKLGGIPAVIYGCGEMGRAVTDRLLRHRTSGYVPVLILDNEEDCGDEYSGVPIIHDTGLGPEIVKRHNIKMAIIAMPELKDLAMSRLINHSASAFRYNVFIPDFFRHTNIWMSVRDFGGILGFASSNKLNMYWNLWIKRFLDIVFTVIGVIIISPLFLLLVILIKLDSPGPVVYKHERIGRGGKPFMAYKFRSMVKDADQRLAELLESRPELKDEWERNQKIKDDPRVTRIGRWLRKTSLDEIPQVFNILRGDMSLVGPRPIVRGEVKRYGEDFNRIFSVKPGLTGLWQVSGRSDTDYAERIAFDTYYLQSWSVWLDLWVMYKTVGVVLHGKGAY